MSTITRQRGAAAAAAAVPASAASSMMSNLRSKSGGSNSPTLTKLRSCMTRKSRFNLRKPSLNSPVAPATTTATPAPAGGGADLAPKKSSKFRGVTKHRTTGRFEAHLWDKAAFNNKQKKKNRQVYLGAFDDETSAAQAYDLAALKYWGCTALLNFKVENYTQQLEEMGKISKSEFLAGLRRTSSGFSRGQSWYRGVARHHNNGR